MQSSTPQIIPKMCCSFTLVKDRFLSDFLHLSFVIDLYIIGLFPFSIDFLMNEFYLFIYFSRFHFNYQEHFPFKCSFILFIYLYMYIYFDHFKTIIKQFIRVTLPLLTTYSNPNQKLLRSTGASNTSAS